MQKTMKIVCRRPTTDEKRKKMFFVGRRNTESSNFHSSSGDETKNTAKTARRRPTKARITHFLLFQPLGKSESPNFCFSNPLESQKTGKNRLSSTDDEPPKAQIPFDGQQQKGTGGMPVRHAPMCCIEIRVSTSNKDFPAVLAGESPRCSEKRASCSSGWHPGQAPFPIVSG